MWLNYWTLKWASLELKIYEIGWCMLSMSNTRSIRLQAAPHLLLPAGKAWKTFVQLPILHLSLAFTLLLSLGLSFWASSHPPFVGSPIAFPPLNELEVLHIIVGRLLMKMLPNDATSGAPLVRKCYTCWIWLRDSKSSGGLSWLDACLG